MPDNIRKKLHFFSLISLTLYKGWQSRWKFMLHYREVFPGL